MSLRRALGVRKLHPLSNFYNYSCPKHDLLYLSGMIERASETIHPVHYRLVCLIFWCITRFTDVLCVVSKGSVGILHNLYVIFISIHCFGAHELTKPHSFNAHYTERYHVTLWVASFWFGSKAIAETIVAVARTRNYEPNLINTTHFPLHAIPYNTAYTMYLHFLNLYADNNNSFFSFYSLLLFFCEQLKGIDCSEHSKNSVNAATISGKFLIRNDSKFPFTYQVNIWLG